MQFDNPAWAVGPAVAKRESWGEKKNVVTPSFQQHHRLSFPVLYFSDMRVLVARGAFKSDDLFAELPVPIFRSRPALLPLAR